MNSFISALSRLNALSEQAEEELSHCITCKTIDKGGLLLREGQICRYIYFIEEGLTKTSFVRNGKEFIMKFFPEQVLFTVVDSFSNQRPSEYAVTCLEKTTVSRIAHTDMQMLCRKHHTMALAYCRLLAVATTNMMKRISEMLEESAGDRYQNFLDENGHLLQRINLGDLASYLGITQVSLSRIRAGR